MFRGKGSFQVENTGCWVETGENRVLGGKRRGNEKFSGGKRRVFSEKHGVVGWKSAGKAEVLGGKRRVLRGKLSC